MQNPLTVINFILSGFYNLFRSYTVWFAILMLPLALWFIDTLLTIVIRSTMNTHYVGLFGRFFSLSYRAQDMRQNRKEILALRKKRDGYYTVKTSYFKHRLQQLQNKKQ